MDDFGSILERDYGLFRPGRSGMKNIPGNRGSGRKARDVNFENSFRNSDSFGRSKFPHELGFRGGGKSSNSLNSRGGRPGDSFGTSHSIYDEVFASNTQSTIPLFEDVFRVPSSRMKVSELRDNDIFRGIPIFRKSSSRITYEDIFAEGIEDPSAPFVFNDVVASRLTPSSRTSSSGRQSPAQLGTPRKQSTDSRMHQEFPWSAETRNGNVNEALKQMPSTSYGSFLSMSGSFKPVEDNGTDGLGNASPLSSLRRPQVNGFSKQLVALVGETELKANEDHLHHIITAESPANTGSARTWVTVDKVNLVTKPTENLPPSRVAPSLVGAQARNPSDEPVLETSKVDSGPPPSRVPPPIIRRNPSDEPTAVEAPADLSHSSDLLDKVLKDRSMQVEKSSTEKVLAWQERNLSQQAEAEEVWESSKEENNQLVPVERQDSKRSATLVRLRTERAAIERIAAEVEEAAAEQAKVRAERAVLEQRERDARAMLVRQEGNMFKPNGADIEGYRSPVQAKAFYEQTKVRSGGEAEQPTFVEHEVISSGDDQRDEMAESDRHGKRVLGGAIEHEVARLIEEPERISSENDHRDEMVESEHQEKREDVGSGIQHEVANLNQDPVKGVEEFHIPDSLTSTIIGSKIAVDRTEEKGPVKRHDSFEINDSVGNMQQAASSSNEEVKKMGDSVHAQTSAEEEYENVEHATVIVKEHEAVAETGIPTDANAASQEHESIAGSYVPEEEAFKGTPMHTEQCESAEEATGVSVLTTNSEGASDSGSDISIDTISSFEGVVNDEAEPVQSAAKEIRTTEKTNGCREIAAERLEKEEEPAPETPERMERSHAGKKKAEKSSSEDAIESAWAEEANKTAAEAEERAKEEARRAAERSLVARITAEVRERAALEAKAKAEKAALDKKQKEARLKQEARVESRRTKLSSNEYVSEEVAKELEDHQAGPPKAISRISLREQLERERQLRLEAEKQQLFKKEKLPGAKEAYGDTEAQRLEARLRAERTLAERITAEVRQRAAMTRAEKVATETTAAEQRGRLVRQEQEQEKLEKERERLEREQEREREIEREKDRINLERVAQEKAEAAAAAEKAEAEAAAKSQAERRIKMERAAVDRATAEARARAERAAYERAEQQKANGTKSRPTSAPRQRFGSSASMPSTQQASENGGIRRTTSTANLDSDKYSNSQIPREFQDLKGETPERRKARLERHQRTLDRAAKALAQKNQRDLELQSEQAERQRLAERLEAEIKRWSAGKDGNIRALLSTLQYVLWSDSGWKQVPLTELVSPAAVKKAYRRATLCVHPDKMQQKRANVQQKYIAEKVFNILQVAWNKFNSQENV